MNNNYQSQLDAAKAHFYACRLVEAYHLFRRFFDRIPFRVEKDHAEHVAMFVRTLWELGKSHELKFYVAELEKHWEKNRQPEIAYALAVVYRNLPEPKEELAKNLFEDIIRNPNARQYQVKAKMMLAHYYDWKKNDVAACRELIFSIEEPTDPSLKALWEIWKAFVLIREKKFSLAEQILSKVFETVSIESDWYAYYSAKVCEAILYQKKGDLPRAKIVIMEVQRLFEGKNFKSLKIQLDDIEKQIRDKTEIGVLRVMSTREKTAFTYENHSLELKPSSPSFKLLIAFVKKGFIDKATIVRLLYDRMYDSAMDDRLIYYHIHALRKRLETLGIPEDAIVNEKSGYRLVPKVEIPGGELWV